MMGEAEFSKAHYYIRQNTLHVIFCSYAYYHTEKHATNFNMPLAF